MNFSSTFWAVALRLRSFPKIAYPMATRVGRFVTSPQHIFESEFPFGTQTPLPLIAAAKCLVLCIEVSGGGITPSNLVTDICIRFSARAWRRRDALTHVLAFELHRGYEQAPQSRRHQRSHTEDRRTNRPHHPPPRGVSFVRTYGRREEADRREHDLGCESVGGPRCV